ncbi:hypothetical protein P6P90_08680 [Ectobacillus antri]|uniref:Uncharacterized protein n=1 Tax=Ectobacillus antri TaxID=2486280 RepID=A0ABT6H464_9BACI|nr:hypothetical protein [Ectobacillus antri]MDG4656946.1 hypothetical protein [Ectobacillus antri]MDG5754048.1 hypothetical protein [Ectobacillus antri]
MAIIYERIFAPHQAGASVSALGGGLIYNIFSSYTWGPGSGHILGVGELVCDGNQVDVDALGKGVKV